MSDTAKNQRPTLEMRVAAIEDKLAAMNITEQEMATYQKVANLLGGQAVAQAPAAATPALSPIVCVVPRLQPCVRYQPCIRSQPCIYECTCGPCACIQYGSGFGGGFGTFGA